MTTLKLVMEHQLKMLSPGGKLLLPRVITNGAFRKTITIGSRTEALKNDHNISEDNDAYLEYFDGESFRYIEFRP